MKSKLPGRRKRPAANTPSLEALLLQMDEQDATEREAAAGAAAATGRSARPVMTSQATLGDAEAYQKWQARQAAGCPSKAEVWPAYKAWPLSFLLFWWFDPLVRALLVSHGRRGALTITGTACRPRCLQMKLGMRDQLQPTDIWEIAERDKSAEVCQRCSISTVLWCGVTAFYPCRCPLSTGARIV